MKTKRSTLPSFDQMSRRFAEHDERVRTLTEMQNVCNSIVERAKRLRDEHMFRWLIERATENFREQLSSNDPCLLNYFVSLFRNRAPAFTDETGFSGFPLPPSKMRIVPGAKKDQEVIPGVQTKVQRIINANHRPSVSGRALQIYLGPDRRDDHCTKSSPSISLVIKTDGVSAHAITAKHLAGCRVALIEWRHGQNPISPDTDFEDKQDYMLKLVELSVPETMFEPVFRIHGAAKLV